MEKRGEEMREERRRRGKGRRWKERRKDERRGEKNGGGEEREEDERKKEERRGGSLILSKWLRFFSVWWQEIMKNIIGIDLKKWKIRTSQILSDLKLFSTWVVQSELW